MPTISLTDAELEALRNISQPRRSPAEAFTDTVLVAWAICFPAALAVVGVWMLFGGVLPD